MTSITDQPQSSRARVTLTLQLARTLFHLIAVASVTVWGFLVQPLPFPGVFTGVGFLVLSVVVWALFLSPKPMLRTEAFGEALIELLLLAAGVAALLDFGIFWLWPALYGVAAATVGYTVSIRRTR